MRPFVLILLLTPLIEVIAQNEYNLVGTLFVKDGATMNYSIYFKEIKGKINDGYSITGLGTNYETKSDISGTISKNNLLIKENGVLKTEWKSSSYNEFCHLTLNVKKVKKSTFEGTFTGEFVNGDSCASGKVILMEKQKLEKKVKKIKRISEAQLISKPIILNSDKKHSVSWSDDRFKLVYWDPGVVDNDIISIKLNGEYILKKQQVTGKKKNVKAKLINNKNVIEIIAENEGDIKNNTARIELIGAKQKYLFTSNLVTNKKSVLILENSD